MGEVGLTIDKILVIMVIAMFVIGPDRLPGYAKRLGEMVRGLRRMSEGAKDRLKDEMGPEFDEVDWRQLDPRQYDPRRIIRDALLEDEQEARSATQRSRAAEASGSRRIGGSAAAGAAGAVGAAAVSGLAGTTGNDAAEVRLHFDEEAT